ncbi:MAG: amidohydrolase [Thermoprotei archaeon]|nr:MAG: amidohydrolase [Thermoprotei archaeon]
MGTLFVKGVSKLYTPSDVLEGVSILIEDGRFRAVGKGIEPPPGAEVIDGGGLAATPGLIDPCTHIGVYPLEWEYGEHGVEKSDVATPHLRVVDAVDPYDPAFREARESGVTTVGVHPGSYMSFGKLVDETNIMPGTTAVYRTDGAPLVEEHGVVVAMGEHVKRFFEANKLAPTTRMGMAALIRVAFRRAREWMGKKPEERGVDPVSETLARVLRGELVAYIHAFSSRDIAILTRLLRSLGVERMVVVHGAESHRVADLLKSYGVPVILGPIVFSRRSVELRELDSSLAAKLEELGVLFSLTTDHPTIPIQYLTLVAAAAVGDGLDPIKAIESITLRPAKILGLDKELGSVEPGKVGDLVLWSGDPLDPSSRVVYTIMSGEVVYSRGG